VPARLPSIEHAVSIYEGNRMKHAAAGGRAFVDTEQGHAVGLDASRRGIARQRGP
jgi:hypothetical protein